MSSTTSRRPDRGQALALFVVSLTTLLLAGALAIDGGMIMVERRTQQNAADAAAIAGARFLVNDLPASKLAAQTAARETARQNGYEQGVDSASVSVYTPPRAASPVLAKPVHQGPGHIEVRIGSTRPSLLASIAGIIDWDISARAVAVNGEGALGDFAILALDPEGCRSMQVTGSGKAVAHGNINVDSNCAAEAMNSGGTGEITVVTLEADYRCVVVGGVDTDGGGTIDCMVVHPEIPHGDPLETWPVPYAESASTPPVALARAPLHVDPVTLTASSGPEIPDWCPGAKSKPADWFASNPKPCTFKGNKYRDSHWIMYPGAYPGGLDLSDGNFYFMPGIYYVAGGGIDIGGGGATARTLFSDGSLVEGVDPGDDATMPPKNSTYGVMFYNTDHPTASWDAITMNGGYADFELLPLHYPDAAYESTWNGFLVFNDRDFPTSPSASSVTLNGGGSNFSALGLIYSPSGLVTVNGNSDVDKDGNPIDFNVDQFIAWNYKLNGNGGSIQAWNNTNRKPAVKVAGLVE